MLTLIRKARRRLLYNDLLSQSVVAVCAALAAFILLLILGTEILNWYWLVIIPVVALGIALYRVRQRVPALYVTAQIVDRRMELADTLSTAVFFSHEGASKAPAELRRRQCEQAERVAAGVDVRRATPYTMPRSVYSMVALLVVASSLFALRYGLTRRLDLGVPMARILEQALGFDTTQTANAPQQKRARSGDFPQEQGDDSLAQQTPVDEQNQTGDPLDDSNDQNASKSAKPSDKNSKEQEKADSQNGEDQQGQGQERASDDENANRSNNAKEGQNQQSGGQNQNGSNSSSLLSKMREAMQNLLSSMKQQPSGSNAQQQQQQQNNSAQNSKQKGQQNAGKQQKGEKQNGQAGGEEQDPDLSNESQQAQNTPGQGDDAQPSNKQPGGGVGNRDGSKDIKQAEQLAAMGKISQIIGKRSANLSGEATVEVQSTVQQLRTAYADRTAQHADAGGEVGRDEIPAAFESYVQQYFEQVHKQPLPKK